MWGFLILLLGVLFVLFFFCVCVSSWVFSFCFLCFSGVSVFFFEDFLGFLGFLLLLWMAWLFFVYLYVILLGLFSFFVLGVVFNFHFFFWGSCFCFVGVCFTGDWFLILLFCFGFGVLCSFGSEFLATLWLYCLFCFVGFLFFWFFPLYIKKISTL